jgi:hypothetical protein
MLFMAAAGEGGGSDGRWIDVADMSWYSPNAIEFTIKSNTELAGLAKIVNGDGDGVPHDNFEGKTIRLVSDIDLAGREWTPIGDYYHSSIDSNFKGTFDGGGGTIANMTINIEKSSNPCTGLFWTNGATIRGVNLSNFSVSSSTSHFDASAGGLVGNNYGTITDCTASGSVSSFSSSSSYSYASAGGLVGYNEGTITACTAGGSVSSFSSSLSSSYAGGLVGINHGTIKNSCTANGNAAASSSSSSSYAGGLVGINHGIIKDNCAASGSVFSSSSSDSYAGGLVGYNEGTITDCTASGSGNGKDISAEGGSACKGGFIGYLYESGALSGNRNETGVSPAIGWDERKAGASDDI